MAVKHDPARIIPDFDPDKARAVKQSVGIQDTESGAAVIGATRPRRLAWTIQTNDCIPVTLDQSNQLLHGHVYNAATVAVDVNYCKQKEGTNRVGELRAIRRID